MKTILIILLSFTLTASFAQPGMHFPIPVQELDTVVAAKDSTPFRMHPIQLDIDVRIVSFGTPAMPATDSTPAYAATPDIYGLNVTTTFYENIKGNPYYKAKNSTTVSYLEVPETAMNLPSTLNPNKTYNLSKLNPILAMFGLMYRTPK